MNKELTFRTFNNYSYFCVYDHLHKTCNHVIITSLVPHNWNTTFSYYKFSDEIDILQYDE